MFMIDYVIILLEFFIKIFIDLLTLLLLGFGSNLILSVCSYFFLYFHMVNLF